jgi:hypothetical protein
VSFHAVKGLYETDRTAAVEQLQKLARTADGRIRNLVKSFAEEWGMT